MKSFDEQRVQLLNDQLWSIRDTKLRVGRILCELVRGEFFRFMFQFEDTREKKRIDVVLEFGYI